MQPFTIRPALASDESFLREMLWEALFVAPGDAPFERSILDDPSLAHHYVGFGTEGTDVGRIAELETGHPIGAVWVRLLRADDPGYGYVDDQTPELGIAVVERFRGSGVGLALMNDLVVNVPRTCLSVDRRNPAVRLYQRLGYATVKTDGESLTMLKN